MAGFVKVAKKEDLAPASGKMVEVSGKKIALFNVEGHFYFFNFQRGLTVNGDFR